MGQSVMLTGMVLLATPMGEFDKRVVLLTRERGRITAFAKGARRQNSPLLAATNPFTYGSFICYEGRSSYTIASVEVKKYFEELSVDFEAAYYGFYFVEVASYYTRENNDESEMLKLLYVSLKGLLRKGLSHKLVRAIFELKAMVVNGEYPEMFCCVSCGDTGGLKAFVREKDGLVCGSCMGQIPGSIPLLESTIYTLQFIVSVKIEKLYTFTVSEEVMRELTWLMEILRKKYIDRPLKTLDILNLIITQI